MDLASSPVNTQSSTTAINDFTLQLNLIQLYVSYITSFGFFSICKRSLKSQKWLYLPQGFLRYFKRGWLLLRDFFEAITIASNGTEISAKSNNVCRGHGELRNKGLQIKVLKA